MSATDPKRLPPADIRPGPPRWLGAVIHGSRYTLMLALTWALIFLVVTSCGCPRRGPVFSTVPPSTLPPEVMPRLPSVGDCPESVTLQAGVSRPCRSRSIPPTVAAELNAKLDIAKATRDALEVCYSRRRLDRNSCNVVIAQYEAREKEAAALQARAFFLGAGVGASAAVVVAVIIAAGAR